MGKNLKGKELGIGISQRKDGLYTARFTDKHGKRRQKYFKKLQECRNWIADAQFQDEHGGIDASGDMTVDAWFEYWITEIKEKNSRPNTIRNYMDRFRHNIKPYIGNMLVNEVKPMHCQNILNKMASDYKNSTINLTRITLFAVFESAVENGLILKNPITKAVKCAKGRESKSKRALTIDEQKLFLEAAYGSSNYCQYALILQTGLRLGEMTGLMWSDIDFEKKVIHVKRTMEYVYSMGEWRVGPPKSKSGIRDIPLTQEAISLLRDQKRKIAETKIVSITFSDLVFINRDGGPTKKSSYNKNISSLADKVGIERFSMHILRHTFATRCIEAGMKPKTLQSILGHSSIGTTMDLYVHVTKEEKIKEVKEIEERLRII